jgi:asparagine synthase (glutamine-hydrolysing)
VVLTAHARIDNRDDLIPALDLGDLSSARVSDEELILEAYQRWGEQAPEKLLGDFAFTLWDEREGKLFCARDHLGVKPFYYHLTDQVFLFASEIKAILCHPEAPRRLNEIRVADYLAIEFEDKEITFYRDILRLPPGCCMTVRPQGMRRRNYWSLDPTSEIRFASNEEYAEAFREIFTRAVKCRLRSLEPTGVLLSGGLDSSSIVCVARRLTADGANDRPITFTASFPDFPEVDEQPYIEAVQALGGIENHRIRVDRINPLLDMERIFWHEDEPFHAPNLYVYWALAKAAREQGVRILLDGFDGDSIVSHGFEFLTELGRSGRWGKMASEIYWLSRRFHRSRWWFLRHYILRPMVVDPVRQKWHRFTVKERFNPLPIPTPMNQDFIRRIQWEERFRSKHEARAKPIRSLKEEHWRNLTWGIHPFFLEVNDKAAAAFGMDHRHPFYDRRLVEFCFAVPPDQKLCQGWDRVIQRRAMDRILPEKIRWRISKSNWGPSFKRGMMELGRSQLDGIILKESGLIESYVDVPALREAYARCRSGQISPADGMSIWVVVTLALWLRQAGLGT